MCSWSLSLSTINPRNYTGNNRFSPSSVYHRHTDSRSGIDSGHMEVEDFYLSLEVNKARSRQDPSSIKDGGGIVLKVLHHGYR